MFEIVLVAVIVDPTAPVYSLQARRPPTRRPRGFPPVQQLQCRDSGFNWAWFRSVGSYDALVLTRPKILASAVSAATISEAFLSSWAIREARSRLRPMRSREISNLRSTRAKALAWSSRIRSTIDLTFLNNREAATSAA